MKNRITILKEKMLNEKRYASIEQARIITRIYKENETLSVPMKRALSLKAALEEIEIGVEKEELIVGNRTKGVRAGDVKYTDLNNDGDITDLSLIHISEPTRH